MPKEAQGLASSRLVCSYYEQNLCRSCGWIERNSAQQIQDKEQKLKAAFAVWNDIVFEPSVLSPLQGFRNRVKISVTGSINSPILGLVGEKELDLGREILSCPIHHEKLNQIITALPDWIQRYQLIPYRIKERRGELKSLIGYFSSETQQAYLRFVLRSQECVSRIRKLIPSFQKQFPEVVCISANIQPTPHALLEGVQEIFLTERQDIDLRYGDKTLKLRPQAFVQTNHQVADQLYQIASHWIQESRAGRVLELFCGQGPFSLVASSSAKKFLGVEVNSQAVEAANENARRLGLNHLQFIASDAAQVEAEVLNFRPDLILVNPPRRGLGHSGVELLKRVKAPTLIYSSCYVETLQRDIQELVPVYQPKNIRLFDLFPHTEHFETLVRLDNLTG